MDFGAMWVIGALILLFGIFAISLAFFTVHTKQAAVVERFGKFSRIAGPGLNFKTPLIEKVVYVEDLNMQLMDVPVMSKTKDDATVTVPVRVQYFVLPDKVKEALDKRGLTARVDTGGKGDIHGASYQSYHTTTPNGFDLQISFATIANRHAGIG